MKKLTRSGALALILCVAAILTSVAASADVIWEPDDDFYNKVHEDCEYVGRTFIANGEKGYIGVYKNPGSKRAFDYFENGVEFYVSFIYTDKNEKVWGVVQYLVTEEGKAEISYFSNSNSGWIPMEDMIVKYDHESFCDDHEKEFKEYEGGFRAREYNGKILFWTYPGSGEVRGAVDMDDWEGEELSFSYIYTDNEGRQWGYVNYFFANKGWVCLSDPTNKALPVIEIKYDGLIPASSLEENGDGEARVRHGDELPTAIILAVLVTGVVILTAALIRIFWNKNK